MPSASESSKQQSREMLEVGENVGKINHNDIAPAKSDHEIAQLIEARILKHGDASLLARQAGISRANLHQVRIAANRPPLSLCAVLGVHRKPSRTERMRELFEAGWPNIAIAKECCCTLHNVSMAAKRHGWVRPERASAGAL